MNQVFVCTKKLSYVMSQSDGPVLTTFVCGKLNTGRTRYPLFSTCLDSVMVRLPAITALNLRISLDRHGQAVIATIFAFALVMNELAVRCNYCTMFKIA